MPLTQAKRQIQVFTPLPFDKLVFYRMEANEELGRLSHFDLELLSEDDAVDINAVLGKKMSVQLDLPDGGKRYFNGHVSQFSQEGSLGRFARYRAILRPWFWMLTRTSDCRIFQNKTVPDIAKEIFREHGFTDFEEKITNSYRNWEYCVQYRETDFNFISRLLEQEGIYYYFRHEMDKHILVLADSYSSHQPYPGYAEITYYPPEQREGTSRLEHIYEWSVRKSVQSGCYALTDYDFEKPKADISAKTPMPRSHANAKYEIFDYPGEYKESSDGTNYTRTRIEELQVEHEQVNGTSNARGVANGSLFTLKEFTRKDQNREYLIINTDHVLQADAYETNQPLSSGQHYECYFTAMNSQESYRPARITPKPVIQGPQTAIVVGKAGEEIDTDKYGQVLVQFHWDRYGERNEKSSCRIRIAEYWAGKKWGSIHIPRIGQEVIVEFLEGDPDRPIITGRVYNADNMPPYDLPANKTQSGVKSRSTKGGSASDFNEIRFEDKKGAEEIYVHAEHNMKSVIENNETRSIGVGRSTTIHKKDETMLIKEGDRTTTLMRGDDKLKLHNGNRNVDLLQGDCVLSVMNGDAKHGVPAGTYKVNAKDVNVDGTTGVKLTCGASSIKLTPADITLSCGACKIKLTPATIEIVGPLVKIN